MHPDLRTEVKHIKSLKQIITPDSFQFQNILKPTYNRVDMTEVEILDDGAEARDFNPAIVEVSIKILIAANLAIGNVLQLREKMVTQMQGDAKLRVIDDINNLV